MSESEKIEIRCDTDLAPVRFILLTLFVMAIIGAIYIVDPLKSYVRGQIILGEAGVLIVRFLLFLYSCVLFFALYRIYTNASKDLLLGISRRGLEVNDEDATIIEWKNIAGLKVKTLSGGLKKEIHKIIVFPRDGHQGKIVKIDIYCSGLKIDRFKEIVNSFSSDLVDKIT